MICSSLGDAGLSVHRTYAGADHPSPHEPHGLIPSCDISLWRTGLRYDGQGLPEQSNEQPDT